MVGSVEEDRLPILCKVTKSQFLFSWDYTLKHSQMIYSTSAKYILLDDTYLIIQTEPWTIYSSTFELVENSWTKQLCRILPRNADFVSLIWWVCISFSCSCRNVTLICPRAKFWMIWKLGSEAMKCHFFFNIGLLHSQPHLSLWRKVGSTCFWCVCVCVLVTFYLDTALKCCKGCCIYYIELSRNIVYILYITQLKGYGCAVILTQLPKTSTRERHSSTTHNVPREFGFVVGGMFPTK